MSTVRREIVLPVERERAWELLTEPAELCEWLADDGRARAARRARRCAWSGRTARPARASSRRSRSSAGCASAGTTTRPASRRGSSGRSTTRPAARASSSRSARWCRSSCTAIAMPWRARGAATARRSRDAAALALRARDATSTPSSPRSRTRRGARSSAGWRRSRRAPRALAGELPVSRQAVAKHLAALDRAGLVAARREGRETRYTPHPEPMGEAMAWMAAVGARWDERLARLARRARRRQRRHATAA